MIPAVIEKTAAKLALAIPAGTPITDTSLRVALKTINILSM